MYVILDVIYNHSGNNWFYRDEETGEPADLRGYRCELPRPVHGWRSASDESIPQPERLERRGTAEKSRHFRRLVITAEVPIMCRIARGRRRRG